MQFVCVNVLKVKTSEHRMCNLFSSDAINPLSQLHFSVWHCLPSSGGSIADKIGEGDYAPTVHLATGQLKLKLRLRDVRDY